MAFPVHTIQEYFKARVPDLEKFLPGFAISTAEAAAMAYYWRKLFPADVEPYNLNEGRLSELQRSLIALKMVCSAIPQMLAAASAGASVSKVTSGPESFQFEERIKYYQQMMKNWAAELDQMESSMGLATTNGPLKPPSFRRAVPCV